MTRHSLIISALATLLLASGPVLAQYNPLETRDEARQRHNAERWQQYEENNRRAPLGGYREPLGDPAPRGTERPGFNNNESLYSSPNSGLGGYDNGYRSNPWGSSDF